MKNYGNTRRNLGMRRLTAILLSVLFALSLLPSTVRAASPSVSFEGWADKNTSNFRIAQVIEVKTSGFAAEAVLNYTYYLWLPGWHLLPLDVFRNADQLHCSSFRMLGNDSETDCGTDMPFFSVSGCSAQPKAKLRVTVKDVNENSSTYGQSATGSISGLKAADLSKDVLSSSYGMFVGDKLNMLSLLAQAGLMHITCDNAVIDSCTLESSDPSGCVTLSDSILKYTLTAVSPGSAMVKLNMHKKDSCAFHGGQSANGTLLFKVFKEPAAVSSPESITLKASSLEEGVKYTVNGVTKTFDGTNDIVFDNLAFGTQYTLDLSYSNAFNQVASKQKTVKTSSGYPVSYNAMGHGGESYTKDQKPDTLITDTLTQTGYTFLGWYDNASLTGVNYLNNQNKAVHGELSLYAKWKTHTYSVTFDAQGGTGSMADQAFTYDQSQALSGCGFSKTGYVFGGWSLYPGSAAAAYADGEAALNLTDADNGNVTLYAIWEIERFTLTYNKQSHGDIFWSPAVESYEFNSTVGDTRDLNAPGYDFYGWYDTAACTGADQRDVPIKRNMTYYAKWIEREYAVNVTLLLDGNPYTGQTVQLIKDSRLKYTLTEADGVYSASGVTVGSYDVYVNGADAMVDFNIDGMDTTGTQYGNTLYAYTASVTLEMDGAAWTEQTVSLGQGGVPVTALTEDAGTPGTYTGVMLFTGSTEKNYDVYVNGQDAKMTVTLGGGSEGTAEVGYYSVTAAINKNGTVWSDTVVTLELNGAVKYTLKYDSGSYRADAVLIEKSGGSELSYDLVVGGVFAGGDTEVGISSGSKTAEADFYTVSYIDSTDSTKTYATQTVRSGLTGIMPVNPYREGWTFSGWSNNKKRGENTEVVTVAVEIKANWQSPGVNIGDYIRCDEAGVVNGASAYYRLGNLSINGFPAAGTPMKRALIDTFTSADKSTPDASKINFVSADGYAVTLGDDPSTATVTKDGAAFAGVTGIGTNAAAITLSGAGASVADLQGFIRSCMVVNPAKIAAHTVRVRVFGATA